MSVSVAKSDDNKLESVLQHIFAECGVYILVSSPCLTRHKRYMGDKVRVSRIIEYIEDQLPTWPIDRLAELRKCLAAVSSNGYVSLQQFKEVTKRWISNMQRTLFLQDDNNNTQESFDISNVMYANCNILSDADSSLKTAVDMDRDVIEFELRMKLRELQEENNLLHDELERHVAVIDNLKVQYNNAKKQLDRYVQKCQQLEKENDEQREELNKVILKEKTMASTVQRCAKEKENLTKRMETMEIELQSISALEEKIEKLNKEKTDATRQVIRLQEEFDEKENECKYLMAAMAELEDTSISLKKSYEYTINSLREQNRQLADENTELQSLSMFSQYPSSEKLPLSPSITDGCYTHSTPYKCTTKVLLQESLYTELKASGFVAGCMDDSCKQELEEKLCEYNDTISTAVKQLEKIIEICAAIWSSSNDTPDFNPQNSKAHDIETLKQKTTVLLNMATEEFTKKSTRDASTQLRADAADATETLAQFGIPCFRDLSPARTQPHLKTETDLRSIVPHCVNDDTGGDSFLSVIRTYASRQNRFHVIDPIVEELHDIIENTLVTLTNRKEHSPPRSSRYRLLHTLPSCPQTLQSPPNAKTLAQLSSSQGREAESSNSVLARGDSLTRENGDEIGSAPFATDSPHILNRSDFSPPDEPNRTNEMSKIASALQAAPQKLAVLKEESGTTKTTCQVPEVSSASNPSSPRRKISVYCRSFDMAAMQDSRVDPERTSLEVRQSPSDDSVAQTDEKVDEVTEDRSTAFKHLFNYRCTKTISDSSTDSTPTKSLGDSPPDDESPCKQPSTGRAIRLAPMRLKLPRKTGSDLNGTPLTSNRAFPVADSTESDVSLLSSAADNGREKDNDASVHLSATFIVDKRETELKEDPHSQTGVQRVGSESQLRVGQSVDSEMSSREDSSDSETELAAAGSSGDQCASGVVADATAVADEASVSASAKIPPCKNAVQNSGHAQDRNAKRKAKGQRLFTARRSSFSEGENISRSKCRCRQDIRSAPLVPGDNQSRVFPSLTDIRLQESGIATLSDTELNSRGNLSELELQKKYTAFSLCLCTDRITLPQRVAISLRQRDQSEKNLLYEMEKMQQDIQDTVRQRNSVCGRMTLRRPSFSAESPKWEAEKLSHNNSSSIGELRGIFEQTESRRSSREENNNMIRSNSQSTISPTVEEEVWTSAKQETCSEFLPANDDSNPEHRPCARSLQFQLRNMSWRTVLWSIVIFFLGFFVNQTLSTMNNHCPLNSWSIERILSRYIQIRNIPPHPM